GILVGARGLDHRSRLLVPAPVVGRADEAVAVEQTHVEPDRRVERTVLVQTERSELVVEPFGVFRCGEIPVSAPPVGNRPCDPVDELADARLSFRRVELAVEVFTGHDVSSELAPSPGNLAAGLLEDRPTALVLDLRSAELPVHLVEGA